MYVMSVNSNGIPSHNRHHSSVTSKPRRSRFRLLTILSSVLFFFLFLSVTLVKIDARGTEPSPAKPGEVTVIVTAGDTLWSIARDSGLDGSIQEAVFKIKARNGLTDSVIEPGQQLIVPVNR